MKTVDKCCFVVMPIEDEYEGYGFGHFKKVYDYIIKPSVIKAGFEPVRADEVCSGEIDYEYVISRIVESPIVIFDLSSCNNRILTGLEIRLAFNKASVVIKDNKVIKLFDSEKTRCIEYTNNFECDSVDWLHSLISESILDIYHS